MPRKSRAKLCALIIDVEALRLQTVIVCVTSSNNRSKYDSFTELYSGITKLIQFKKALGRVITKNDKKAAKTPP